VRFLGAVNVWLGWWAALFGLYFILAAKLQWQEAVVGAAAAALAATAATVPARTGGLHFQPRWPWLRPLARLPGRVLADCGVVGLALWRRLVQRRAPAGGFRSIPFDPGGDDAVSAARRALVTAGISLAPNTYVVAFDRRRGLILIHQLVPTARPPGGGDREWPL
jgi:multisubunit Na+/H+ antiporter MnhE subunit